MLTTFAIITVLGLALSFAAWSRYFPARSGKVTSWTIDPEELGPFSHRRLFLISVAGLFLEMLLIRWVSSEIRIFAYLKNFVLIACFLGFGIGFFLCRRRVHIFPLVAPPLFLAGLIALPFEPLQRFVTALPVLLGATSNVQIWGVGHQPLTGSAIEGLLIAALATLPLFMLISVTFVPIGQVIGLFLERSRNGIAAYSVNVAGSLCGIALYTLFSFMYAPPVVWFVIAGASLAFFFHSRLARWSVATTYLLIVLVLSMASLIRTEEVLWSPYQKLSLSPVVENGELIAWDLETNDSWHQKIINLAPKFVSEHEWLLEGVPLELNAYNLPYKFFPSPDDVLILGAGMGNDVAAALRNGAESVVAVEIDPLIVELGRERHFEQPYDSPKVEIVVDDARSYLQNAERKFDLIVFSLLDSHTTNSQFSNIRIDNYVYTLQAMAAAKRLLSSEGVMIVKFQVQRPWIAGRLHGLLVETFGYEPLQVQAESTYTSSGRFFIGGSVDTIRSALADPAFRQYVGRHGNFATEAVPLTTDDWPYFYQKAPGLPLSVAVISVLLLITSAIALKSTTTTPLLSHSHFFLLGGGFLLLETSIISRMALLFGTTWVVNSIVIAAIFALILLANLTVALRPGMSRTAAYAGLFVTISAAWTIPMESLLFESFFLRLTVSTLVLCLPVFFAGIIFIRSFAEIGFSGQALGANLLGALAGGLLESISLWTGLRALLLLALVFYLGSLLSMQRKRQGAAVVEPEPG